MRSDAATVEDYLDSLPADRRATIAAVRKVVLDNLPSGYVEAMNWGMIAYEVPLEASGKTYNGQPLMVAALGSQKKHLALYLCGLYCLPDGLAAFEKEFAAAGKKLDMGKACLRFRTLDDLNLHAVANALAAVPVQDFIAASKGAHRKKSV